MGHGGGFSGGLSARGAPAFRAGSSLGGRLPFTGTQFSGSRSYSPSPYQRSISGVFGRRPGNVGEDRYRRPYTRFYGQAAPYGAPAWTGPAYPGDWDFGFYDDSGYTSAPPASYPGEDDSAPTPPDRAESAPPPSFRPSYQQPQPDPKDQTGVTLIFKDGRPSEQIRNYLLTRTTLYVQEKRLRQIPVDQLDLAATEKVNKDADVDFQLPRAPAHSE